MGLEGIVSKRRDSHYRSGRSPDWIKSKNPSAPAVKRLVDGLRTLMLIPMPRGPREFGNMWPRDVVHDWVDLLAQEDMETDQRELLERAKNRDPRRA
jgi:hypothetical protein